MIESIHFENRNHESLAGVIHFPDAGAPHAFAIFAHCFTCTKNLKAGVNIANAMAASGIAVLRFDFTGLGESEGDFSETHFSSNIEDLIDAAQYLEREHEAPAILVGHSLGGTAVLAAARDIPSSVAVATIGSPANAAHILHMLEENLDHIREQGEAEVDLGGRPFRIKKTFIDDINSQSVQECIAGLRKALLVMHSPLDATVSIDEAANIFTTAKHPKSFVSLDDADHLLSRQRDSRYAGQVLAAWANRYLDLPETQQDYPPHRSKAVVVSARKQDQFLSYINADGHPLLADEPASYGGTDKGPSPYDYLSAALGTCTAMTLNMYARRKKIPLDGVTVATRHNKIHAEDCEDCSSKAGKIDQFDRAIQLQGDLSDEQRRKLLDIADRCPVHKTLHNEVDIKTRLDDQ